MDEKVADYVLVEDVQNSWEKREQEHTSSQRILTMSEKVLQSQNKWKGAGKFVLRKVSTVSMQSFFNVKIFWGTPESHFIENVFLGTHNICFD